MIVLTVGMLVACNSGGEGDTEQVELKVFIGQPRFREQYERHFEKFIEQVRVEQGIELTISLEMPNDSESGAILQTRMAAGDSPDIFSFHPINDTELYTQAGWLADLSDEPFIETLYEPARDAVTYNGQIIGVPLESVQWGYMFNRELFNDLELELPNTLSEMKEIIEILHENDIQPFLLSYGESYIPQLFLPLIVGSFIETTHPHFIEDMNNGEASFADLEGMFEIMDLVHNNGTDRPFEIGADQGAANFANGQAAMYVQGPWMADTLLAVIPDFDFGVAPLPISHDPGGTLINMTYSNALGVSNQSENKELAKQFINFILDEDHSSSLFESLGFNRISTVHDFPPFPWLEESSQFIEQGRAYVDPLIPSAVKAESERMFQSYFSGSATNEDVIVALDRAWEQFNRHRSD